VAVTQTLSHGGDHVAAALQAAGVPCIFTLCGGHISPILSARQGTRLRIVDVRDEATAVFAADAQARLTGRPGVAAVTAGPGISNTITALKNAQLAQSPLLLIGGAAPTALQGRGALQDIDQRPLVAPHVKRFIKLRRVRDLAPRCRGLGAGAARACRGRCSSNARWTCCTTRPRSASGMPRRPARARRWPTARCAGTCRHAARMFAGSARCRSRPRARRGRRRPARARWRRPPRRWPSAERPLLVIGSQALLRAGADRAGRGGGRLGVPVYLSGMARGLLGRDHPLQMRHAAPQRAARGRLRAAGRRALRLPARLRPHVRRSATLIAANRSAKDAR
jgi:hypothetical protein